MADLQPQPAGLLAKVGNFFRGTPAKREKAKTDSANEATLKELRQRFTYARDQWRDIYTEGAIDKRYVSGDPWDDQDRQMRRAAGRPCLTLDELGQYVNQSINDIRQHKRAIQVTPLGNGADDKTANLRANRIRQIEYRSNAQQAYTTMFENTVQGSYGFLRVNARYLTTVGQRFNQELIIDPIMNPDLVTIDPDIVQPDGSDMRYAFIRESWPIEEFKRRFPKASIQNFDRDLINAHPDWLSESRIQIAEYWTIESKDRTLLALEMPNGQGALEVYQDDLKALGAEDARILDERVVAVPTVVQYLTNGLEILDRHEWFPERIGAHGKKIRGATAIPIVCCFGKILYVDDGDGPKRKILSLIRLAREPFLLYCFTRTSQMEIVGRSTKNPVWAYEGQLTPKQLNEVAKSVHEPVAALLANATTPATGAQVLPLPVPNQLEPPVQALEVLAEACRRAIQAAIGTSPLPTQAQKSNQKSGVALQRIEDSQQRGSYHFVDHYENAITRTGFLLNELVPHVDDAPGFIAVRTPADETSLVHVNAPNGLDPKTKQPSINTAVGDHDITLSTGPAANSEREAASDFADTLVQNPAMAPILPLAVKLKNLGPIGDQMVKVLKAMLPPQIAAAYDDTPDGAIPAEVKARMGQLEQENQALKQQIATDSAKATIDGQFMLQKTDKDNATKIEVAKLNLQSNISAAALKSQDAGKDRDVQIAETLIGAEKEARLLAQEHAHDAATQGTAHAHEAVMAHHDRAHDVALGQVKHDQAKDLADQGQGHALETLAAQPTETETPNG